VKNEKIELEINRTESKVVAEPLEVGSTQRLRKNISGIVARANALYPNQPLLHLLPNVVIFDPYVLASRVPNVVFREFGRGVVIAV
jgi:hypothetical protein